MKILNRKHRKYLLELRKTIILFAPLLAAVISQKGMSVVNSLFMGTLGSTALAASSLADAIFSFFAVVGLGLLSSVGVLVGRAFGEKSNKTAATVFYTSMVVTFIFSGITIILLWFAPEFLLYFGQEQSVINETLSYIHAVVWGLPALLGFFALLEFSSSLNHPRIAMLFSILSIPLVAMANYFFVSDEFDIPWFGIAGIGISTAIVNWLVFIGFYIYVLRHKELKEYIKFPIISSLSLAKAKEIVKIGFPAGMINLLEIALVLAAALMMGYMGTTTLAAHQIVMVSTTLLCRFPMALGITSAIRISQSVGAKKYKRIPHIFKVNFLFGLALGVFFSIIYILSSGLIVNMFIGPEQNDYSEIWDLAVSFIFIGALTQLADYILSILNGSLRGLKDTFVPMLICLSAFWVGGIGGGYLFGFVFEMGGMGVWIGQLIGIASGALLLYFRFRKTLAKGVF